MLSINARNTNIRLPDHITAIAPWTFYQCSSLTSVIIPNEVTSIGEYAFSNCSNMTSVTIPDSVKSVGEYAFYNCSGLTSVNISDLPAWCTIAFNDNLSNPLYYAQKLYLNDDLLTELIVPESVTSIAPRAFYNCSSLENVTIPNSVTSIGFSAFSGCSNLASITLPFVGATLNGAENTHFGYIFATGGLYNTSGIPSSLKTVVITGGTSIAEDAFYNCTELTNITLPDGVASIGDNAFDSCVALTSITIPSSVKSIGFWAFGFCSSLTKINFRGTKLQWNAITKDSQWNYQTGSYAITYNYTDDE